MVKEAIKSKKKSTELDDALKEIQPILEKTGPAQTMAIRVDIDTYRRLQKMAAPMPLASFMRAFSTGSINIGEVPGYEQPTLKDIYALLEHIRYEQDGDGANILAVLNNTNLLLKKGKTSKAGK